MVAPFRDLVLHYLFSVEEPLFSIARVLLQLAITSDRISVLDREAMRLRPAH